MKDFAYGEFSGLIGDELDVYDAQGATGKVTIKNVTTCPPDGEEWHAFRILLESASDFTLTQGSYLFRHPTAGECDLFISPKSMTEYEAPITRKREQDSGSEVS